MIQEYLFMDNAQREVVEAYAPVGVQVELYKIENSACWTATYSLPGENEESAKRLSKVNDYVLEHFNPTVLTNESSAYFNKKLFPLINEFERKLRKLLYLKSALYSGDKKIENIRDLESMDLGGIFDLLFTDANFVKSVKTKVNEKSWQFTKREIIAALSELEEDTVWNNLLGVDAVKALSKKFIAVKDYRNDVMHAHNIGADVFQKAKNLFAKINEQIDMEIGMIIETVEEEPNRTAEETFNTALSNALQAQNVTAIATEFSRQLMEMTSGHPTAMQELLQQIKAYQTTTGISGIKEALRVYSMYSNSEIQELAENMKKYQERLISPELQQSIRTFKEMQCQLFGKQAIAPTSLDIGKIPENQENSGKGIEENSSPEVTEAQEEDNNA